MEHLTPEELKRVHNMVAKLIVAFEKLASEGGNFDVRMLATVDRAQRVLSDRRIIWEDNVNRKVRFRR